MAPRLEDHQHELIVQYIAEGRSNKDIAELVNCNSRSVTAIRGKLRKWGATTQPNPKPPGRPGHISDDMRDVLLRRLKEKPTMYQDEMASFLQDVFKTEVSYYMVGRLLKTINWSRKESQEATALENQEFRDYYLTFLRQFEPTQLVFIDESSCDTEIGYRRTNWTTKDQHSRNGPDENGDHPVENGHTTSRHTLLDPEQQWNVLPAITVNGVLEASVYHGATDVEGFEYWLEHRLLPKCNRFPGENSIIVMDMTSLHVGERINQLVKAAGCILVFLPLMCPDLNPNEEFLAELKHFVRHRWGMTERTNFDTFLRWAIEQIGNKPMTGAFRNAQIKC